MNKQPADCPCDCLKLFRKRIPCYQENKLSMEPHKDAVECGKQWYKSNTMWNTLAVFTQ